MPPIGRLGVLWRGDRAARAAARPETSRFARIFDALAQRDIHAEPVVFAEDMADEVRAQLLALDGVLVWVDPLSDGRTRAVLDPMLREIAACGTWVSSHPDVILKLGVKEVLYRTRHLGWGTDTHLYRSSAAFREAFPARLQSAGPRVLKRNRGNGGQGVWKVDRSTGSDVRVLEARRGSVPEVIALGDFMARCASYFEDGALIDQPFQPRLADGMIRCYMAGGRVAGFGHQFIKALIAPPPEGPDSPAAQPGPRIMHPATAPQFQRLRSLMEGDWCPQAMACLGLGPHDLPIIWDADFLYGPRTAEGADTYVLCEVNASSVYPIPDQAPEAIARLAEARLRRDP
jgi:hypothetical protein